jgi:hypothetical protein
VQTIIPVICFLVLKYISDTNYFSESAVIPPAYILIEVETAAYSADGDLDVASGCEKIQLLKQEGVRVE